MFCVAKTDELAVKTVTTNKEMAQQMSRYNVPYHDRNG